MLVVDLACEQEHRFEGWFGSGDDFESQRGRGLISCPLCGSSQVQRRPSATRLNVAHLRGVQTPAAPAPAAQGAASPPNPALGASSPTATSRQEAGGLTAVPPQLQQLQQQALQMVRQVLAATEDVGERFAEEARRMHYGEAEARAIRGQASAEQAAELSEEGIEVLALPLPLSLKGTLQ